MNNLHLIFPHMKKIFFFYPQGFQHVISRCLPLEFVSVKGFVMFPCVFFISFIACFVWCEHTSYMAYCQTIFRLNIYIMVAGEGPLCHLPPFHTCSCMECMTSYILHIPLSTLLNPCVLCFLEFSFLHSIISLPVIYSFSFPLLIYIFLSLLWISSFLPTSIVIHLPPFILALQMNSGEEIAQPASAVIVCLKMYNWMTAKMGIENWDENGRRVSTAKREAKKNKHEREEENQLESEEIRQGIIVYHCSWARREINPVGSTADSVSEATSLWVNATWTFPLNNISKLF